MSERVPRVSVVMPVYNGEAYLAEAIDSVLGQTFPDFELVAVDDASRDASWSILESYGARDSRVRAIRRTSNGGHHVASNQAMTLARGEYVARLDQDDLALPTRLAESVRYLDAHPEIGLLATGYRSIAHDGRAADRPKPMTHELLRSRLVFDCCIVHSSVTVRRDELRDHGLAYRDLPGPQDYDLWVRMLEHTRGASIAEPLVVYRRTEESMSELFVDELPIAVEAISNRQLEKLIGDLTTDPDVYRAMRRVHRLRGVRSDDFAATDLVLTVYDRLALEPDLDAAELRRARRRWIVRACSTIARDEKSANPDRRFASAVLRHDPLAIGSWVVADLPRRAGRHLGNRLSGRREARPRRSDAGVSSE